MERRHPLAGSMACLSFFLIFRVGMFWMAAVSLCKQVWAVAHSISHEPTWSWRAGHSFILGFPSSSGPWRGDVWHAANSYIFGSPSGFRMSRISLQNQLIFFRAGAANSYFFRFPSSFRMSGTSFSNSNGFSSGAGAPQHFGI